MQRTATVIFFPPQLDLRMRELLENVGFYRSVNSVITNQGTPDPIAMCSRQIQAFPIEPLGVENLYHFQLFQPTRNWKRHQNNFVV